MCVWVGGACVNAGVTGTRTCPGITDEGSKLLARKEGRKEVLRGEGEGGRVKENAPTPLVNFHPQFFLHLVVVMAKLAPL